VVTNGYKDRRYKEVDKKIVSWTVSTENDTAMTAYIDMRLAQDGVTLTLDQAIAELLAIGSMVKNHGDKYF
jgi:hypothetical protein